MAALWIEAQSVGRTRVVLFGKPSGMMERFDLVVAGAEVQLPPRPNVVPIRLPLMRARASEIEAASATWRTRFAALPRPLVAILVGGPTVPFAFDHRVADGLQTLAHEIASAGGTPYVTTSRRTPRAVAAALRAGLPPGARLYHWTPDSADNPYLALLGLADGCIVTGDSVSMIAEVVRARKPLGILELPLGPLGGIDQMRRSLARRCSIPTAVVFGSLSPPAHDASTCSMPHAISGRSTRCCSMPGSPGAPVSLSSPPRAQYRMTCRSSWPA
jgi:hypothetical protein